MPVVLFAVFVDLVGFGLIVPILPFLTLKYGGDAAVGTSLVSIYALMAFLAAPLWGRLSDRFGRKLALALTFAGAVFSYLTLAFADSLFMLFVARGMSGAMAGNVGIVMAIVADMTDKNTRGKAMGMYGAVMALGFAFGPGIGGVLGSVGGEANIFLPGICAAVLSFIAFALTLKFIPETNKKKKAAAGSKLDPEHPDALPGWRDVLKGDGRILMLLMFAIIAVGQSISFSITPFWSEAILGWKEIHVGFFLMGIGVAIAIVQASAVGPLFKRLGEIKSLIVGALISVLGSLLLIFGPKTVMITIVGMPVMACGLTIAFPALNSLVSHRTDPRLQGTALGLGNGMSSLGRIFGPLSAGYLFATLSPVAPFVVVLVVGLITVFWSFKELQRGDQPGEPDINPQV